MPVDGVNADWLARVETGFGPITPDQVAELLDSYGTPRRIRDAVVDLSSRPDGPPWPARHVGHLKALVRDIYTVESESALVHTALGIDAAQADLWDAWQEIDALALSHADSRAFLTECRAALDEV